MRAYLAIRDWIDRQWRAPGVQFKTLVLPAMAPAFAFAVFERSVILDIIVWSWFAIWTLFVFWRYWAYMKEVAEQGDEEFDRRGKFRLSKEYHDAESATAARKRKRRD